MALKLFPISIPIFSSRSPNLNPSSPPSYRAATEIRYSRWDNSTGDPPPLSAGSSGTSSVQPRLSIRGRRSKYFKPRPPPETHPAFRAAARFTKLPPKQPPSVDRRADVRVGEGGVSYVIDGAPFEFKYSYTETPTVKPLRFREAPYSPFGPDETGRPWTGRKRLPGSKKKLPKFDSFRLPPPDKKGVKPIQAPGPYLPGTGPRYARTREEILGEPLSPIEVRDLVNACHKTRRQLNMGRDGFTHNMLENIHALWKRKRVCKIKCKGVCTVDMDSVCQQLEEKTGGKIIYRKGGVVYLFRGRNYNVTTRPRFPLMLWKPASPMYPRLIQKAPAGLTIDEASDMRKRGLKLTPIRKLAKNGLYSNLVHQVREAFEVCELVKIDCQGLNASDFRKIGAKLRDLVPCVLISFERESILIWRGKEWKSSLKLPLSNSEEAMQTNADSTATYPHFVEDPETGMLSIKDTSLSTHDINVSTISSGEQEKDQSVIEGQQNIDMDATSTVNANELESPPANGYNSASSGIEGIGNMNITEAMLETAEHVEEAAATLSQECDETRAPSVGITELPQDVTETMSGSTELEKLQGPYLDGVLSLWKQAIESGSALVLVDENLDADIVYQSSVAFSHSAPPGPVFRFRPIKVHVEVDAEEESPRPEAKEPAPVPESRGKEAKSRAKHPKHIRMKGFEVPQSQRLLGVDELAKLLA